MKIFYFLPLGLIFVLISFLGFQNQNNINNVPLFAQSKLVDHSVPGFSIPSLFDRINFTSKELKGRVLINVFASWCISCREEHEELMELKKAGIPVYGLNWKDDKNSIKKLLKDVGNPYKKIGVDRDGKVAISFGITGAPETFLIDNGKIKRRYSGPLDGNSVIEILEWYKQQN